MAILAKWAFCRQFWGKYRADQIQRQLFLLHGCFPQIHDPIQSPWHSGGTGFAAHIFHMWSLRLGQDRRLAKVRSGNYVFWPGGPHCIAIPCNFFFFSVCVHEHALQRHGFSLGPKDAGPATHHFVQWNLSQWQWKLAGKGFQQSHWERQESACLSSLSGALCTSQLAATNR